MPKLVRGLGLAAAISINIANTIGTGVFLKARVMTCNVGDPITVMAVWLAAGILVLFGALTYSELMSMMPEAGGEYVILREAYGRPWAFFYGWTYIAVSRGGALAAQAFSGAIFLNIVMGGALEGKLVYAAVVSIAIMTALNCLAVKTTGAIATVLTVVKVVVVLSVGAVAFIYSRDGWSHYLLSGAGGACIGVASTARGGLAGIGAAMLGAMWGFQGWQNLTPMCGEVRDPQRNISRAFVYSLAVVGFLYLFANAAYFYALTPNEVASIPLSSSVATALLTKYLGPGVTSLMAMGLLASSLGALHTGIAPSIRVPYAMACDGLYFKVFAKVSESTNVPIPAAILLGVLSASLAFVGNYDKLSDAAIFTLWLFYGLTGGALFILRRRMPDAPRPYRVFGYPFVPAIFLIVTAIVLLNSFYTSPQSSFLGLGFLILGVPFYLYWSRKSVSAAGK